MEGYRWKAAVVTLSDKGYAGERKDQSGPLICEMLTEAGYDIQKTVLLPDEREEIKKCLCSLSDVDKMDIIFTTGGTGFAPRDRTPEATLEAAARIAPGIAEAMRPASPQGTPRAMFSRGASVIRGQTVIINLPGSPKAVRENLEAVLPSLDHGLAILTGRAGECAR